MRFDSYLPETDPHNCLPDSEDQDDMPQDFPSQVRAECDALAQMLIDKNKAYGNSALEPVRIFSRADVVEQIWVRIDDKLSRLSKGSAAGEDVTLDLLGYLIILRIAEKNG